MAADQLSRIFSALADPTRRTILARLTNGDATVSELAEPFAISLPAISRHLKVLERAELITRGRSGQFRSSSIRTETLDEAVDWIAHWRGVWDERFARLDTHLERIAAEIPSNRKASP